jgi:hypothetical protein
MSLEMHRAALVDALPESWRLIHSGSHANRLCYWFVLANRVSGELRSVEIDEVTSLTSTNYSPFCERLSP